jgi:hypothetical protein
VKPGINLTEGEQAMTRYSVALISFFVVSMPVPGPASAQTPGQIPVFVDASGTLGDSTIAQDSSGNVSLTNATGDAVLAVSNTVGAFGKAIWGQTSGIGGIGVRGTVSAGTGVLGESSGDTSGGDGGVRGVSYALNGRGVIGEANEGPYAAGVVGISFGSGFGVAGQSESGFAVYASGKMAVAILDTGGSTPLCWNNATAVATCSSSLRYKTDVHPFVGGLDIVSRLRPIAFNWKQDGLPDVGLGAEDVEQVQPLLTFRNDKGEIEGVKYNQLSAVFVNAIKDQQAQIERQHAQIEALKTLVCRLQPDADACR